MATSYYCKESYLVLQLSCNSLSHIEKEPSSSPKSSLLFVKCPEFSQLFHAGQNSQDLYRLCLFTEFCQCPTYNEYNVPDTVRIAQLLLPTLIQVTYLHKMQTFIAFCWNELNVPGVFIVCVCLTTLTKLFFLTLNPGCRF